MSKFILDMQESEYFGETLNGQFSQMMRSDTRVVGRFVDFVRGRDAENIGYVLYLGYPRDL